MQGNEQKPGIGNWLPSGSFELTVFGGGLLEEKEIRLSENERTFLIGLALGRFPIRRSKDYIDIYTATPVDSREREFLKETMGHYGEPHEVSGELSISLNPKTFSFMLNPRQQVTKDFLSSRDRVHIFFAGLLAGQRGMNTIIFHDQDLASEVNKAATRVYGTRAGRIDREKRSNGSTTYSIALDNPGNFIRTIKEKFVVQLLPKHLFKAIPQTPNVDVTPYKIVVRPVTADFRPIRSTTPETLPPFPTLGEKAFFRGLLPGYEVNQPLNGRIDIVCYSKSGQRRRVLRDVLSFWQKYFFESSGFLKIGIDENALDSPPSDEDILNNERLFVPYLIGHIFTQAKFGRIPSKSKELTNNILSRFTSIFGVKLGVVYHDGNRSTIIIKGPQSILDRLGQHPAVKSMRFYEAILPEAA